MDQTYIDPAILSAIMWAVTGGLLVVGAIVFIRWLRNRLR